MNKFFTTLLGALVGVAMFSAVGVGLAHAHHVADDEGYGIVREGARGR